jgi:predicted TPR repeat methyltransferase
MPGSVRENDDFVRTFVLMYGVRYALDVGAGKGTYADLLKPLGVEMVGIEVWQPYIEEFDLHNKYDGLREGDARRELKTIEDKRFDLVIFGDIMEHMTKEQSLDMWAEAERIARWGLISVPVIHYPQGAEFGNPYEVHVQEHLHPEDVRADYGPFDLEAVYNITGTFIKRF